MRKLLIALALIPINAQSMSFYHKDTDWNFGIRSYEQQDVKWTKENDNRFLEFKLDGGRIGNGATDAQNRHGAPFWERNEFVGEQRMGRNKSYSVSFQFRIVQGFKGERETFFQVHSWDNHCPVYPQIMLKFDNGRLQIDALNERKFHTVTKLDTRVDDVVNQWIDMKMTAEPAGTDTVKYTFSGNIFGKESVSVIANLYDCSNQMLKFGIYRPGRSTGINDTSIIQFDKIQVNK